MVSYNLLHKLNANNCEHYTIYGIVAVLSKENASFDYILIFLAEEVRVGCFTLK